MNAPILFVHDTDDQDCQNMASVARKQGWQVVPASLARSIAGIDRPSRFAAYGGVVFVISMYRGYTNICDIRHYQAHYYHSYLDIPTADLLLNPYRAEARSLIAIPRSMLRGWFVKSDTLPMIAGAVLHSADDVDRFVARLIEDETADRIVIMGPFRRISHEYRFFWWNGRIWAGSLYFEYGRVVMSPQVPDAAAACAVRVGESLDAVVRIPAVIDIAHVPGEHSPYRLLEINCPFSSGLYACNPDRIIALYEDYLASLQEEDR